MPPGVRPKTKKPKAPSWAQTYGPGSTSMSATKLGSKQALPNTPPEPNYTQLLGGMYQPTQTPGENNILNNNPGSQGRSRGGGGGGGVNPDQIRNMANELFTLNESPYWMMQAGLDTQRRQAASYNPDFAGIEARGIARGTEIEGQRNTAVQARLAELAQLGQTLAGQQGTAIAGAARDLGAQGVNMQPYMQQANQMGSERVGALGNQGAYMTMLGQGAAGANADYLRGLGTIRAGGEATLENNRTALYNQLDQGAAAIQQQAAQARLANDQAKREFMLRYGVA